MTELNLSRLLLFPLCLLLAACAEDRGGRALENYQSRLENVFESLLIEPSDDLNTPSPETEILDARRFVLPAIAVRPASGNPNLTQIDLLDFLRLYGCRLQEVVALSNASLGKLAPDSQRLLSTLRFIELAPECITLLVEKENPELAQQLTEALESKRSELEAALALSVFQGAEYRAFWKIPAVLDDYPLTDLSGESERALLRLVSYREAWLDGRVTEGRSEFEEQLFLVSTGDGGALLKSYVVLVNAMYRLNDLLERILASSSLCRDVPAYSTDVLRNVVQKFFVGDVQVWAAALNKRQYEIGAALSRLEEDFKRVLSDDYQTWTKQRDDLFLEARSAVQQHVEKLQVLLDESARSKWCDKRDALP